MTIFVQRASECLTDHLPHGDGLICYSLLRGLADRGHQIYAYTNRNAVKANVAGLIIKEGLHRVPANSLADYERAWKARKWLQQVTKGQPVDIVWRMHPYNTGCPTVPYTGGRPLVVGPLFYGWPTDSTIPITGRPRLGIGLGSLVMPFARRGWSRTLRAASLVLCATDQLTEQIRPLTNGTVATLPVIVDPPIVLIADRQIARDGRLSLVFVANLVPNKRPALFCEIVAALRTMGIAVTGTLIGDGSEKAALQRWCADNGLSSAVRFLGRVPNADVLRHLAEADLLVSTSFGEPYGRSIVEAMSVGTPAVCHRSGGPADYIIDGVDGVLIDDLDAAEYARGITDLLNAGKLSTLGRAARAKARSWRSQSVIERLEKLLLQVISAKTKSASQTS